jgi:SAM-dependent methyltransferase
MKVDYPSRFLRCPVCRADRSFVLFDRVSDEREVREGTLACKACGAQRGVTGGVAVMMLDPPDHVAREAAGLERFAALMRTSGWDRDRIRQLPEIADGYWYAQTISMMQLMAAVDFRPGESLLDVGSNTCWAANRFAMEGLEVTALDIATTELQGLYTADYFIEDGTSYFERVLASMNDMPFASGSLDYVYCCEVLHHNDAAELRRTIEEAHRVLKPGGKLLVVNETLKTVRDPHGVHVEAVEQFDGHEHAHWATRYRWEAIRAGFKTRVLEPAYHPFFGFGPPATKPAARATPRQRLVYELQASALARRAYLSWLNHIAGGVSVGMIAIKPPRERPAPRLLQRSSATRGAVRLKT